MDNNFCRLLMKKIYKSPIVLILILTLSANFGFTTSTLLNEDSSLLDESSSQKTYATTPLKAKKQRKGKEKEEPAIEIIDPSTSALSSSAMPTIPEFEIFPLSSGSLALASEPAADPEIAPIEEDNYYLPVGLTGEPMFLKL